MPKMGMRAADSIGQTNHFGAMESNRKFGISNLGIELEVI